MEFIQSIKAIPSEEGRQAELALFRRHPDEAERILLQASPPLVYRAIKLNINLFRWARALDLALKHKVHVETVLAYRQKYLQSFERDEVNPKFLQYFKQVKEPPVALWKATSVSKCDVVSCVATCTGGLRLEDGIGQRAAGD